MNEKERKRESKYEDAATAAILLYNDRHKFNNESFWIQLISESIYRTPAIFSGYISESCVGKKLADTTVEHYLSRTISARMVVKAIARGKSFKFITSLIKSRSRVHRTTSEENTRLVPFQQNPEKYPTWRDQYAAAGITLVKYDKPNSYVYMVGGKEYEDISVLAKEYSLSKSGVVYRCNASSEKYKEWKRIKK